VLPIGHQQLDFVTIITFYKIINDLMDVKIPDFIVKNDKQSRKGTSAFKPLPITKESGRNNFWYRAISIANLLPSTMFNYSMPVFKKEVRSII
jgi:hypothetical protein